MMILRLPAVSFGAVSAIVTSVGLIIGFGAAELSKPTIIAGLLIVGLADNLTDSLSIHIYQESEKLEQRAAFVATLGNFATRLFISLSFIAFVLTFSTFKAIAAALTWGILLLACLTWAVAKSRNASIPMEILKHLSVATVVIVVSHTTGMLIHVYTH